MKNELKKKIPKIIIDLFSKYIISIFLFVFGIVIGAVAVANGINPRVTALEDDNKPIAEVVQQIPGIKSDIQQIKTDSSATNIKLDKLTDRMDAIYNILINK